MQLKDVMTPGVEVIAPDASIYEAAEKMSHRDVGPLPVCDGERLIGMLTDRDITGRAVAGRDPLTTPVSRYDSRWLESALCHEQGERRHKRNRERPKTLTTVYGALALQHG